MRKPFVVLCIALSLGACKSKDSKPRSADSGGTNATSSSTGSGTTGTAGGAGGEAGAPGGVGSDSGGTGGTGGTGGHGGYTGVIDHESTRPDMAFTAKVEAEFYLESSDQQSEYYAARGRILLLSDIDIGDYLCAPDKQTELFDTTTTTLLALRDDGTYTFNYLLNYDTAATCTPKDPDQDPITLDHLPIALSLLPDCNPLTTFDYSDPELLEGSASDPCDESESSWTLERQ
jgi:hypothetical protein